MQTNKAGTWQLGDLTVNRIGYGTMRSTGSGAFHAGTPSDRDRALGVIRKAVELGVNHIDTAAFYFSALRSANELVNSALAPYQKELVIAAKVGPVRDVAGEWAAPARPDQLRGHVEENLRQLGRDHLDLVYLRIMQEGPLAEHFGALAELRDAGLIRHLGISGVKPEHLTEALTIAPVVSVQNSYSVHARANEGLLRMCGELGIAFVPFFAIAGKNREAGAGVEEDVVLEVAGAHGVTAAQVKLAWTLHQGEHVLAIPGTGNPEHLVENLAAGEIELTVEDLRRLG